eukprot:TRINITY_DN2133_c0_g1_i3.p1 TRINITY_DN2133_c0_g1~~TRINITY_DN2133_c0_g1_i3.p1  ORF type:complete len:2469 (-),score=586.53 TRINITY_DN2133_c0_g1_i3:60-7466(-)
MASVYFHGAYISTTNSVPPTPHVEGFAQLTLISSGPHRVVYKAIQEKDQRMVVLKMPIFKLSTPRIPFHTRLTQFAEEFNILSILQTKQIRNVISPQELIYSEEKKTITLVMDFFDGITLNQYLSTLSGRSSSNGEGVMDLLPFITLAIGLSGTLASIHEHSIIHKDVTSSNILYNANTGDFRLIDFGLSSMFVEGQTRLAAIEGTLSFLSCEQTGRINKPIDYRTDLYSMGVVFYHLLLGKLPFHGSDTVEMIHAILAKEPTPPIALRPSVPLVLSKLIMKLLEKNPENRYQSAFGIRADLQRIHKMVLANAPLDSDFPLAHHDIGPRINRKDYLYGREGEISIMKTSFERMISSRKPSMIMINGPAGIGKSAMVRSMYDSMKEKYPHVNFVGSKLDQYQRMPYGCFKQVIQELLLDILSHNTTFVRQWRRRLSESLGNNGALLTAMFPLLEEIIGVQKPVPQLPPAEAQTRLMQLFTKFMCCFSSAARPMVLFFDDVQWADRNSLQQMAHFVSSSLCSDMLIITAYRDDEVDTAHPLWDAVAAIEAAGVTVKNFKLEQLRLGHITQMLVDSLHCSTDKVASLASLIYSKTKGNPFFTIQMLESMYKEKMISYSVPTDIERPGEWKWDMKELHSKYRLDDVVEFVKEKIMKLPLVNQNLLSLAACIGDTFQLETLSIVSEKPMLEVLPIMLELQREGLILPTSMHQPLPSAPPRRDPDSPSESRSQDNSSSPIPPNNRIEHTMDNAGRTSFSFVHDRIQQAAYDLIAKEERATRHLQIAQLMLSAADKDASILEAKRFDIANHLNSAVARILQWPYDSEFSMRILNFYAEIIIHARNSAAYTNALVYARAALTAARVLVINPSDIATGFKEELQAHPFLNGDAPIWKTHFSRAHNLAMEYSELLYLCGNPRGSEASFRQLLGLVETVKDKADIYHQLIVLKAAQSEYREAVVLYGEVALLLGLKDEERGMCETSKQKEVNAQLDIELHRKLETVSVPDLQIRYITDPHEMLIARALESVCFPSYFCDETVREFISYQAILRPLEKGWSGLESYALSLLGSDLMGKGEIRLAYEITLLGLRVADNAPKGNTVRRPTCRGWAAAMACALPWGDTYASMWLSAQHAMDLALEQGDIQFHTVAATCRYFGAIYEKTLFEVIRHMVKELPEIRRIGRSSLEYISSLTESIFRGYYALNPTLLSDRERDELTSMNLESESVWIDTVSKSTITGYSLYCIHIAETNFILHPNQPQRALHYIHPKRPLPSIAGLPEIPYWKILSSLAPLAVLRMRGTPAGTANSMFAAVPFNTLHEPDPLHPLPELSDEDLWEMVTTSTNLMQQWTQESPIGHFKGIYYLAQAETLFTKMILKLIPDVPESVKPLPSVFPIPTAGLPATKNLDLIVDIGALYDKAITYLTMCHNQKNYQLEAIAHEEAGRFWYHPLVNNVKRGIMHIDAAYRNYSIWGASVKLIQLKQEFSGMLSTTWSHSAATQSLSTGAHSMTHSSSHEHPASPHHKTSTPPVDTDLLTSKDIENEEQNNKIEDLMLIAAEVSVANDVIYDGSYEEEGEEHDMRPKGTLTSSSSVSEVDRQTAVKVAQSIASEIVLSRVLSILTTTLLQNTGAQRALLLSSAVDPLRMYETFREEEAKETVSGTETEESGSDRDDNIAKWQVDALATEGNSLVFVKDTLPLDFNGEGSSMTSHSPPESRLSRTPGGVRPHLFDSKDISSPVLQLDEEQEVTSEEDTSYPTTILNFVLHSKRVVILADAMSDPIFGKDEYVISKSVRSVLCMPLLHGDKLVSVVYLENRVNKSAFSRQRLLVCRMIAQQAAISLDNARLYHQLAVANRTLELKVVERTKQQIEANEANKAKSSFLANMSHEIRTPMNGIIGGTDLLLSSGSNLTAEQKEILGIIKHSSEAMLMLINDILDLSKIEAGRLELNREQIVVRDLIDTTVDVLGQQALNKGLDVFVYVLPNVPHIIYGDLLRLRQILLNLLSNAIKFTQYGQVTLLISLSTSDTKTQSLSAPSTPTASGSGTPRRTSMHHSSSYHEKNYNLHFVVRDSGIGIPEDMRGRLFQKFSQLRNSTYKQTGGTGLGLAISKSLVEMMGGSMWIADAPPLADTSKGGPGSEFHFEVPSEGEMYTLAECPHYLLPSASPPFSGLRALFIKQNRVTCGMIVDVMRNWGLQADSGCTIEEAFHLLHLAKVKNEPYHFVLLDCYFLFSEPHIDTQKDKLTTWAVTEANSQPYVFHQALLKNLRMQLMTSKTALIALVSLFHRQEQVQLETFTDALIGNPVKMPQLYACILSCLDKKSELVGARDPSHLSPVSSNRNKSDATFAEQFPMNILIAEDNQVNQKVVQKMLIKLGYSQKNIHLADNGKIAMNAVHIANGTQPQCESDIQLKGDTNRPYDVVLMDVFMPEMDGLEATVLIRQDASIAIDLQPYIVALTANAMRGDEDGSVLQLVLPNLQPAHG